jgi:hypothetical protein
MGKFGLRQFVGKNFQFGQFVFVERIKTDLLKPHGEFSFLLKPALYRENNIRKSAVSLKMQ